MAGPLLSEELEFDPVEDRAQTARGVQPESEPRAPALVGAHVMQETLDLVDRVAPTDMPVLLQGETGVGKDMIAREIHARSPRAHGHYVKVHCAALPDSLLESELFGYEPGAFTGAVRRKLGRFEIANGGTLFLDEISEMSVPLQAKLLHVLQDGVFQRIGSNRDIVTDARIVCASNRSLEAEVAAGRFREDLFFRIHCMTIHIPPLRKRREMIPLLFMHFLRLNSRAMRRPVPQPSARLLTLLGRHRFPGNVRELENLARRLVALGREDSLVRDLMRAYPAEQGPDQLEELICEFERSAGEVPLLEVRRRTILEAERQVIERTLRVTRCNRKRAAEILGVSYSTMLDKIRACGLEGLARATSALD
jgi:transcriptional regulator with PAS, ATPase and Fis domain